MRRIIDLRSYLHVGKGESCCRARRVLDSKNDLYVPDWSYDLGWEGTRCRLRWWRVSRLRPIAAPFVAAAPAGARVRTRLRVSSLDEAVLRTAGRHLGSLAGRDLAARCAGGRLDANGQAVSRAARKRALTAESSSRWAGAITRTSEDLAYRGDEVAAQAASGAVRYDISQDPASGRWYLDASWKTPRAPAPSLEELQRHPVVALDVNAGHLAVAVVAADGNVLGIPATIGLDLAGLPAATRDARLRAAITSIIATARQHGARAIVIEDLDFAQARAEGRERAGSRPSQAGGARPSDGWLRASPPASSVTGWSR